MPIGAHHTIAAPSGHAPASSVEDSRVPSPARRQCAYCQIPNDRSRQKMIRTYGLTHIGLTVRDIDRTIAFYTQVFGARVLYNNGSTAELNTPGCHDIITLNSG